MNVEIITIGDEILIGQIVDTNSAWMGEELNAIGAQVVQITSISDQPNHLIEALTNALMRAEVVLITGGLGPTKDDRTKKTLCAYFNSKLVIHQPTLDHITHLFAKRGMNLIQLNHDQALVPECCTALLNLTGTAPGMMFEEQGKIIVSLPGVPFEMKYLMTEYVLPRLNEINGGNAIVHRTVQTTGIPESLLSDMLETWEDNLPQHIKLAYLPSPGFIRLRLSAYSGASEAELIAQIDCEIDKLKAIIPDAIFGYENDTLSSVIGQLLLNLNATVATAESCTGGYIAHSIVSVPGSSAYFKGSVVAYSNEIKHNVLGISSELLENFGAVSEQVVCAMAEGVKSLLKSDYAIATSGIAGPDGGSDEKPVGTIWIAVAGPTKTICKHQRFASNRERNIIQSGQSALNLLRLLLVEKV